MVFTQSLKRSNVQFVLKVTYLGNGQQNMWKQPLPIWLSICTQCT